MGATLGDRRAPGMPRAPHAYWRTSVRSGSISLPSVPGICLFSVQSWPLARQRRVRFLRDVHSASGFRSKNLPPSVATPLNCRFPPPSRGAVPAHRVGTTFSLKEESLRRHLLTLQSLKGLSLSLSLQALGRWVPRMATLVKQGKPAKAPTPATQFGVPPPLRVFLPLLSPATCGFPAHSAASPSPDRWKAEESQEPAGWRLQAVTTLGCGNTESRAAQALRRLLPNDKCVKALSGFSLLLFTLGFKSLSLSLFSLPPRKILLKKHYPTGFPREEIPTACTQVGL